MLLILLQYLLMFVSQHVLAHITGNLDRDKQAQWLDAHGWKYQRAQDGAILVYTLEAGRKQRVQRDILAAESAVRGMSVSAIIAEARRRQIAYVYLIGAVGFDMPVKVGYTIDLKGRLQSLQSGSPFKLRLIHGAEDRDFAREIEGRIHTNYKARRSHGEWFDVPAGEIIDWINATFASDLQPA